MEDSMKDVKYRPEAASAVIAMNGYTRECVVRGQKEVHSECLEKASQTSTGRERGNNKKSSLALGAVPIKTTQQRGCKQTITGR